MQAEALIEFAKNYEAARRRDWVQRSFDQRRWVGRPRVGDPDMACDLLALREAGLTVTQAAARCGISRATAYRRLQEIG